MERYLYIIIAASIGIFLLGGAALALYLRLNPAPAPRTEQNTPGQNNPGGTVTAENPGGASAPKPTNHLEEDVRLAFRQLMQPGDPTEPRETSIAGDYALQVWSDGVTGGQSVLKYDSEKASWSILAETGGAFSVAGLNAIGVPHRTVLALLAGLRK